MQDFKGKGKGVGKIVAFFSILVLLLLGVSSGLEKISLESSNAVRNHDKTLYWLEKEAPGTVDVFVMGDSLSYTSISPMELWNKYGITTYDGGQAGQKVQEAYQLLGEMFEMQSPKVVVLETNLMFRDISGLEVYKEKIQNIGNKYLPILRNHDVWKTLVIDKKFLEKTYKGFSFRTGVKPYEKGDYMNQSTEKEKISKAVEEYMIKIQQLCEDNGAKLMLLSTPSPKNYTYGRYDALCEYANKHQLDYLDLNLDADKIGIDWQTDSLDKGDHLNLSGAQKVSEYTGKYLQETYVLADHREDNTYKTWAKISKRYEKRAGKRIRKIRETKDIPRLSRLSGQ